MLYVYLEKTRSKVMSCDSDISFDSDISLLFVCDKKDMSCERVPCVDYKGQLSFKMDWVPKTN